MIADTLSWLMRKLLGSIEWLAKRSGDEWRGAMGAREWKSGPFIYNALYRNNHAAGQVQVLGRSLFTVEWYLHGHAVHFLGVTVISECGQVEVRARGRQWALRDADCWEEMSQPYVDEPLTDDIPF